MPSSASSRWPASSCWPRPSAACSSPAGSFFTSAGAERRKATHRTRSCASEGRESREGGDGREARAVGSDPLSFLRPLSHLRLLSRDRRRLFQRLLIARETGEERFGNRSE